MSVGGADWEASASRRNADAASSLWLASFGKQFQDQASASHRYATCKCNAPIGRGDFERRCVAVEGGIKGHGMLSSNSQDAIMMVFGSTFGGGKRCCWLLLDPW